MANGRMFVIDELGCERKQRGFPEVTFLARLKAYEKIKMVDLWAKIHIWYLLDIKSEFCALSVLVRSDHLFL